MKKQIISASLLIVGFLVGATALSAVAGTWTAPGCTPPNCNVDAPVNVGTFAQVKSGLLGLNDLMVKKLQVITEEGTTTDTAGKVLMALDNNGTVGWRDLPISNNTGDTLKSIAIAYYGEAGAREPTAYDDARNWVKVVKNDTQLTPGTKYAFIILTTGETDGYRVLASTGLGSDNGKKIRSRCYNFGFSSYSAASDYNFSDIPNSVGNYTKVSYQGTFVYNPDTNYSNYDQLGTSVSYKPWGLFPYVLPGTSLTCFKLYENNW
jgi:hypothetical protein